MGNRNKNRIVYCHFSFRRPKGKPYGIFAVAFYDDFEGKKKIVAKTRKYDLWQDQQFITAIQSYEHALATIYEYQGMMRDAGVNQIMLVTDNSTLAGWILNPKKNKEYTAFMERAVKPYRVGSYKEIVLGIGLCEPREAEKSYKYCKEDLVCNEYKPTKVEETKVENKTHKLNIGTYQSVLDILANDKSIPNIEGIENI